MHETVRLQHAHDAAGYPHRDHVEVVRERPQGPEPETMPALRAERRGTTTTQSDLKVVDQMERERPTA